MRKLWRLLVAASGLFGAIQALAVTPVPLPITGNLGSVSGTGQPYAGVSIQLQNCASPVSITGYFGIVQTGYQIRASSSGLITGNVWSNDLITCNGTTGNSQYNVTLMNNGIPSGTPQCYQVTSTQGAWNMNTQQSIACSQSPPNPQDAQFRNLNITGCFSVDGGACNGGVGGVTTLQALASPPLTGAVVIACGIGLGCSQTGQTIFISLLTPFTINSFTGCNGALEIGATIISPTCSATYSATPASASITNTDSVDSPLVLTTPFTSGTIVGTFHHTTAATTTITLTAIGSSTQTATQTYTWAERIFGGVGATGATSSVTSSGTTAILSTSDVLPTAQLGVETVGEVFGPYAPLGQNVYLLLSGGSHTFTDNCTGFPFAFSAPISVSFVNSQGLTLSMWLYASTNPLTGSCFSPRVAS